MMFLWLCAPWIEKWSGGAIGYLDVSYVAVACSSLFFLPGIEIISWKKAEREINWGGIVLIATGLSMGMAVYDTGAAAWIAQVAFSRLGDLPPVAIVFCVVAGVSLMKMLFSSNTVTGIIMVPLLIALAKNLGLPPTLVAMPAGISASLAFLLVTSTPTAVIPYSSGYFSIRDMAKAGVWMEIAAWSCVTLSVVVFGRMSGLIKF
jgi:sodium-dependent dicarboxylate transporter 2/3/5